MLSTQKLSHLLASLHSAPLEEDHWQVFFDGLCEETLAVHGLFLAAGLKKGSVQILAQGGKQFNPEMQRLYNAHYWRVDPYWNAFLRNPRIGVIEGEELVSRQDAEKSEFYNELAVPTGVSHAMVLPASVSPQGVEAISIWRHANQKPFEKSSKELMQLLFPHIKTALKTRSALALSSVRAERAETALNASTQACFILNPAGKIVHANARAEALLRLHDGVDSLKHSLVFANTADQNRFRACFTAAVDAAGAIASEPGGGLTISRPSGKRPFYCSVLPLRLPNQSAPGHVLVLIADPESSASLSKNFLKTLFGLTSAETEIASALLAGFSLEEIAERRRVTRGTLRIQIKTIFQKTNTRRQSELVRLLQLLPQNAQDA